MKETIQRLFQTIKSQLIIKLVFPSLLLLLFSFTPGTGTKRPNLPVIRKEVKIESAFQSIRLDGDIAVVLTNESAGKVIIEGKEKDVNKIRYTVKNNKLIIDAQRKNSFDKLTIYLPANALQSIQVNGDVDISCAGFINADDLRISLNGTSTVKVTTSGKLSFDTPYDYDLFWD